MMKTILSYGIVSLLAVSLLAGTGYILLNPTRAQAERGSINGQGQAQGQGRGGGRQQGDAETENGVTSYSQGCENGGRGVETPAQTAYKRNEATQGRGAGGGAFGGAGASDGRGQSSGAGQRRNETVRTVEWETLAGEVTVVGSEIVVQTADAEVTVGLGQASYREGFVLEVGDEVMVIGFYEDGEFKAGSVENLSTGQTIVLRDETGRPMWAEGGRF